MSELRLTQNQRLQQEQVLSPVLIHSLDLLATPILELESKINQELEQNPVLENEEDLSSEEPLSLSNEEPVRDEIISTIRDKSISDLGDYDSDLDNGEENYFDDSKVYDYLGNERDTDGRNSVTDDINEKREYLFNSVLKPKTMEEELLEQLSFLNISEEEKERCKLIICSLDDQGFFLGSLGDLAIITGSDLKEMNDSLSIVQSLDPVGVGASSIKECLLMQLKRRGNSDVVLREIVERYLDEIVVNHLPLVAKKLQISINELKDKLEEIRNLNPYPYSGFSKDDDSVFVYPEVKIIKGDDTFTSIVDNDFFPRIRISSKYMDMLHDPIVPKETKDYIKEKILSANILIKSIEQRQSTLKKIADLIIDEQYDFFKEGVLHLKPLTMKQLADKLGMHEATISRAVSGKYIDTPQGVFPMKYFFSSGYKSENGELLANKGIKERIKCIIDDENSEKPYSDEDIVDILKKDGLALARRTVAKYREEMKIPSSRLRREHF